MTLDLFETQLLFTTTISFVRCKTKRNVQAQI